MNRAEIRSLHLPDVWSQRFKVVRILGHGGMGVVHEARDLRDGSTVAIKTLRSRSPDQIEQLKAEFRAASAVYHRNLVRLYDICASESVAAYTMEYVDGVTIQQWLQNLLLRSVQDWRSGLLSLLTQVAEGLQALHRESLVHRDIKPSNILVDRRGRPVIIDFGLAALVGSGSSEAVVGKGGTLPYMPPEAHRGAEPTPAFDAYSLGVLLFELVCHTRPHQCDRDADWLLVKQHVPQVTPIAQLPEALTQLIRSLLLPDPAARATVAYALSVLRHCQMAETPTHAPDSAPVFTTEAVSNLSLQWLAEAGQSSTVLVGRDAELARLRAQWLLVEAQGPQIAIVTGEPGAGKTALGRRFAQLARERSALVLHARCRAEEAVPFRTLDPLVVQLCSWVKTRDVHEMRAAVPPGAWALARLFPLLKGLPGSWALPPDDAPPDGNAVLLEAQSALRQWLTNLARLTQLVIWLDDVQADDVDSVRLLMPVLTHVDTPPVFWVFFARHEEQLQSRLLQSMALVERELVPQTQVWRLQPLGNDDLRQLAALQHEELVQRGSAGLGLPIAHQLDDAELERVLQVARGNPLWFLQIVRLQAIAGRSVGSDWNQLVRHFVDLLGPDEREVLELLCVSRRQPSLALLLEVYQGETPLRAVVQRLAHLRVVATAREGEETLIYIEQERVAQVLSREFVPKDRARELHGRLVQAMLKVGQFDHPELFYHKASADDRQSAAELAVDLARRAKANHSYVQAEAMYQRALDLGHVVARAELAEVKCLAGNFAAGAHAWLDVAGDPEAIVDVEPRFAAAEALGAAAEALARAGQCTAASALLDRLVRALGLVWPAPPLPAVPRLGWKQRLGIQLGLPLGRPERPPTPPVSVSRFPHPEPPHRAKRLEVLWRAWRWTALLRLPRQEDLLTLIARDAAMAEGHPVQQLLQTMRGLAEPRNDVAVGVARAALALQAAHDSAGHGWMADWWLLLAENAAAQHRWEAALDAAERGLQCCNRAGDAPISRLRLWQVQAEALVGCGKLDELYKLTSLGVPALHTGGDQLRLWMLRSGCHAFGYLARDEDALLRDVLQQTVASGRELQTVQWPLQRAQLELALYQQREVEAVLARLCALPEATTAAGWVLRGRAAMALCAQTSAPAARARWRDALQAALDHLAAEPAPLYRGWRAALDGGLAALEGQVAAAPQHLATAEALFRLGHQPLLASVAGWYVAGLVGYERERENASVWLAEHGVRDVARFCQALLPLPAA